jgi:hypothetical protein
MFKSLFKDASEVIDSVGNAADKIFTSDEEKLAFKHKLNAQRNALMEMQHKLNLLNAKSKNPFNSGWRPSIGWVCSMCIALYFIPKFGLGAYVFIDNYLATGVVGEYPVNGDELFALVTSLLGMGVLRTYEKLQGLTL